MKKLQASFVSKGPELSVSNKITISNERTQRWSENQNKEARRRAWVKTERTFLFSRWSGWFTSWAGVQGKNVVPLNRRAQGVCVMETHRKNDYKQNAAAPVHQRQRRRHDETINQQENVVKSREHEWKWLRQEETGVKETKHNVTLENMHVRK